MANVLDVDRTLQHKAVKNVILVVSVSIVLLAII